MNTKLKIIAELENESNGIHLRKISRLVNSGLPNVKRFLEILEKEKVVSKEKEANLIKFALKEGQRTLSYLKQVNTDKFFGLPVKVQNSIGDFLDEIEDKPLIALIFGSYAKKNYTKESDIDILLVFQKIENTAKRISMRTNTKINPVYIEYKNFKDNFLNKEHNFSKEIRNKVIVMLGIENYYQLLWRFLK
ncbi:MAG: DNA polymerase subunit beta [archaeon GW2011_AR19]|nr:MAG: DNA polymerase subunit beta [archaeon GW2011_AR19]